jgi:hypothetical protein
MKKTPIQFPDRGPFVRDDRVVRRTFEKLEIEDGERRSGIKEWLKRLFRRKDRPRPSGPDG